MRRSIGLFAALLVTACGVTGGSSVTGPGIETPTATTVDPLPTSHPREDPWALFGGTMLDATRALHAAAMGNPYDAKWQCADPKKDIRATDLREGKTLNAKGTPEYVVTVLSDLTLTAPSAASPGEPETPRDGDEPTERKQATRVVARGTVLVFPDARVRWFKMSARGSSYYGSEDDPTIRLKRLPPEIRGAISDLVTTLTGPCVLPFAGEADIAPLPVPQSTKDSAIEALEHEAAELHHTCELVAHASGPWEARLGRMQAMYKVENELATLTADVRIEQGRVCLGRGSASIQR